MEPPTPHLRHLAFLFAVSLLTPAESKAQDQGGDAKLRAQQEELARIRREREELQRRMRSLQSKVHDMSEEVTNIDRQHDATVRVVRSLDQKLTTLNGEVEHTTVAAEHKSRRKRIEVHRLRQLLLGLIGLASQQHGVIDAVGLDERAQARRVGQLFAFLEGQ